MSTPRKLDAYLPIIETYGIGEHSACVRMDTDWGGPADWQAQCSCGWAGTVFTETLYVDGAGVVGIRQDAIADMLTHAGYDPVVFDANIATSVSELLAAVSDSLTEVNQLRARAAMLRAAHARQVASVHEASRAREQVGQPDEEVTTS